MFQKFTNLIKNIDIFGCPYIWSFNGHEESYKTFIGGVFTISTYVVILLQTFNKLEMMIHNDRTTIQEQSAVTNFQDLGIVDIQRMDGGIPYYGFFHHGNMLREDAETCGGSCFEYIHDNMLIEWKTVNS